MKMKRMAGYLVVVAVLFMGALIILNATYRRDLAIPAGLAGRYISFDGFTLRVAESGAGNQAVILVHSSLGSIEDWETVAPLLDKKYRVIAIDRPGHGYSADSPEPGSVALNARALRGLIAALGLKDVVVVGHSYGGAVALKLAIDGLPALKGLVLVAPGSSADFPPVLLDRLITAPWVGRGIVRMLLPLIGETRIRAGAMMSISPNADSMPKNFFDQHLPIWVRPGPIRTRAEQAMVFDQELAAMVPAYPGIRIPVVVLQGDADEYLPIRNGSRRLAQAISGAELETFADTGHYLQYIHPEAVAEAVTRVYSKLGFTNPR